MKTFFILSFSLIAAICCSAQIRLPQMVRDSMILQRDAIIKIWGWASMGEKVTVKFNNKTYKAKADASGNWSTMLAPLKVGGPYSMEISGKNKITLGNILIGDVWFCSGQSNMVHQLNIHDVTYAKEIAEANNPNIRQFLVPNVTNLQGSQTNFPAGVWKAAVGEDIRPFSAVAYFFAKELYDKYKVPVGIINASWGGTPIEAWTSEEGLKDFTDVGRIIQKNKDTAYINGLARTAVANRIIPKPNDRGMFEPVKWFEEKYIPKRWRTISIPGYWEDQGIKDLNGVIWYRKEIDVPLSMIGKPAKVWLGRIVDADELYINGKKIGNTTYQYPQRRYSVPADVLRPGKNIVVIRVTNYSGKGGFVPDKPYCLFAGNDTVDLKGYWQYRVGEVFSPGAGQASGGIAAHLQPTALYNAMVNPVVNYTIKGFCWYQGESNAGKPAEYAALLPVLIKDWRSKWNLGELPFLYVQLPGFMDYNYLPSESNWAILRESQLKALSIPNTAMAVAIDLGEWNDIHPDNKKEVGERLALSALKLAYGETIVHSGPLYQSHTKEGNKIIISFSNTGNGLITNDGEYPAEFAIAGSDKKFVWARAIIDGDKIIVWNDNVANPMYVRYAWADNPVNPNIYNKEGLPASPFQISRVNN
jgi:sialate O-acetylesterase